MDRLRSHLMGYVQDQSIHQNCRAGHGMVFLFLAPISIEVDICPLILRDKAAADKGCRPISHLTAVVQNNPALPRHLGQAEHKNQIILTDLSQPLQKLGAAGRQQESLNSQPPQAKEEQPPQGGRSALGMDKYAMRPKDRLSGGLKFLFREPLQGLFQIKLLEPDKAPRRKAVLISQRLGQLGRRPFAGGLFHDKAFQFLEISAAHMADKTGYRRLRDSRLSGQLSDGGKQKHLHIA